MRNAKKNRIEMISHIMELLFKYNNKENKVRTEFYFNSHKNKYSDKDGELVITLEYDGTGTWVHADYRNINSLIRMWNVVQKFINNPKIFFIKEEENVLFKKRII